MRILAVGGGSGGHVTPVVAVLREIKLKEPKTEIRFWCDIKFAKQASKILSHFDKSIPVHTILAGKLRRYHHLSVMRQLMWPSLVFSNIKDMFLVVAGFFQSIVKLIIWRPDVVFTKGGYVCLPVGVAAYLLHIPLVIHDSDAHPGLTNRILSKWATKITTGAPLEYYGYPINKSKYVGIPVAPEFHEFSQSERQLAKIKWGVDSKDNLIVVTGGGLGASLINNAVCAVLDDLLKLGSVVLISGNDQYGELRSIMPTNNNKFQLHSFVSHDMVSLMGAADVVVTRAGATTILELAALVKPTILIPNGKLTGGHQLKNADVYKNKDAVRVIDENDIIVKPSILVSVVKDILSDTVSAKKMAHALSLFAKPNAARDVANIIISSAK